MVNLELMAKQLKAVSDTNRLKLLAYLKKGEVCACDFVDVLQVSKPAVSQQLKKLKEVWNYCRKTRGDMEALSFKRWFANLYSNHY